MHSVSANAAKDINREFRAIYQLPEKSPTGRSTVYLTGPEDFLEHGDIVMTFDEGPKWRAKTWRFDAEGKVELKGDRKLWFVNKIFQNIANDTTFYLAYGRFKNARYLTNLPGEAFLLQNSTCDNELSASNTAVSNFLTHAIPLVGEPPIRSLIKIRKEERESFEKYRIALNRIMSDVSGRRKRVSKREAQAMYKEFIEPELLGLKSELYQERKRQARRLKGGLGTIAATVALGVFGGIVPVVVKGALAATGAMVGGRLLSKAAEAHCEHGANLREKNDFYFLLRLVQEAEKVNSY